MQTEKKPSSCAHVHGYVYIAYVCICMCIYTKANIYF